MPKLRFRDQNLNQTASLDPLSHFGEKTHETVDLEALNAPASRRLERPGKKLTRPPAAVDETDKFLSELFGEDSPAKEPTPTPPTAPRSVSRSPFSSQAPTKRPTSAPPPPPADDDDFPSFKNFAQQAEDDDAEDNTPRPPEDDDEPAKPAATPIQELSMDEILGSSTPRPPQVPPRPATSGGVKRETPLLNDLDVPVPPPPSPRPAMSRSPFSRPPFSRPPFSLDREKAERPADDDGASPEPRAGGKLRLRKDKDKPAEDVADLSDWDPVDDFSALDALDEPDQPKKP